ncbi:MAG TPA: NAD(P)H-dependent oxidoreductase [Candidatus Dormibacteraeota bacterium]|nr:NAD(P)H-dependent oxidoreductase [Candidatus Dormibacteraeota bacterium]
MGNNIAVVYGSVRSDRQGIRVARFFMNELHHRGDTGILVDPLEYPLPLLDKMYKEFEHGTAPEVMERLANIFRSADGFLIVSGEYNHGIPPALKNLLDHFMNEFFWRPAAIASYSAGRFGGVRAAMQLRSTLAEQGMITIPSLFPVGNVSESFDVDGKPSDEHSPATAKIFLDEFTWYVEALRERRLRGVPYE